VGDDKFRKRRRCRRRASIATGGRRTGSAFASFALDGKVADPVALQAIRDALDRAGLSPQTGIEVEVALKQWEQVSESLGPIQSGSRAEHRKSIGRTDDSLADSHTLPPANDDLVIDAEIVDDGDELIATMLSRPCRERRRPFYIAG
jgi:hypothetical protein